MTVTICKEIRKVEGGYIIELLGTTGYVTYHWINDYWSPSQHQTIQPLRSPETVCKTWEEVLSKLTEAKDEVVPKDDN